MIKLMKDFDKYNRHDCRITRKAIMPGRTFYSEMRLVGTRWQRGMVVSEAAANQLVAEGKAEIVTRAQLQEG